MKDDFLARLEAAVKAARQHEKPRPHLRRYPRPSQELSDALLRVRGMVAHYEPELGHVTLTGLYEYAAQRLLRDTIPNPSRIAADCRWYLADYRAWWQAWRDQKH